MFLHKIVALINILIKNGGVKFRLVSIDEDLESVYATFENLTTKSIYKEKLGKILKQQQLLIKFSSADACKMGYAFGKHLSYLEKSQNEQNQFICNDFNFYNNKKFSQTLYK